MLNKHSVFVLVLTFVAWGSISVARAEVAIIVNSANASSISDSDLSRLFLGKLKAYSGGDKAEPINQKFGTKVRNEFEQKVLKKSASQVKAYWSKRVFSGKGKPPQELPSDKDILTQVAANKNAIGYIDAANVDSSVKVVKTF